MDYTLLAQFAILGFAFIMVAHSAAIMVWVERKVCAYIQQRHGPTLVGPFGLLQPLADVIKLITKEELRPQAADRILFTLAPMLMVVAAFTAFAVVPFGPEITFFGLLDEPVPMSVSDIGVGALFVFAVTSMGIYGIIIAGWASNSKYSLLGALRSSAQMISYELSFATVIATMILIAGTLSLREVVDAQAGYWFGVIPRWNIFIAPLGFIIFAIAAIAETNRAPFDFPEAEQELVAGYFTEYSSMRFAMFFMAEYINMFTMSAVVVTLFLGGWHGPFIPEAYGVIWWLIKVSVFLFAYVWIRWTLPRYRYDQLMTFGWKWLLPAALLNLVVTAAAVLYFNA
jgi:NADH-quinone oxidoreductase subunit H